MQDQGFGFGFGSALVVGVVLIASASLVGWPNYNVYSAKKSGEAQLAEATSSKQIAIQTARAKMESAQFEADAEITRARGVAKANEIIGNGLRDNEDYLRYLYINNLAQSHDQIIYVPTEAGLPILEAGKRPVPVAK